ncbi:MAG: SGNH/GDSL hydrolase family protein [Ignavibacteria bacterium]|jgi:hypothetical protein|nr:SGNH/GDSL hydrolase family protein [Ignavibacteria bacterium]MCU7503788.1 SGNH/GDSL hydrolase family protein [Ignavibacteria bacterium]MCU7517198.1 SGNH/GDSL hydrolase family protein [Ignavibacteria bacterium]
MENIRQKDLLEKIDTLQPEDYASADEKSTGKTKKFDIESIRKGLPEATPTTKGAMGAADKKTQDAVPVKKNFDVYSNADEYTSIYNGGTFGVDARSILQLHIAIKSIQLYGFDKSLRYTITSLIVSPTTFRIIIHKVTGANTSIQVFNTGNIAVTWNANGDTYIEAADTDGTYPNAKINISVDYSAFPATGNYNIINTDDGTRYNKYTIRPNCLLDPITNFTADTDSTLVSNSDIKIPTQKAVKTFVNKARTIKNLLYDPLFEQRIEYPLDAVENIQWFWWDKSVTGTGVLKRKINNAELDGTISDSIVCITGASGANTKLSQTVFFWNHDGEIFPDDVLSFSAYIKSDTIGAIRLRMYFLDRNSAVVGDAIGTANATANVYEKLLIAKQAIPIVKNETTFEGIFGLVCRFEFVLNNTTTEIILPQLNVGDVQDKFYNSYVNFKNYRGLERLAHKILSRQNPQVIFHGDSITYAGDTSQGGWSTSYASRIVTWINQKFGVTPTKRNNGGEASSDPQAMAILGKMCLAHNPDFVSFANDRNSAGLTEYTSAGGNLSTRYAMLESLIRRVKTANMNTDIMVFTPCYEKLDQANASRYTAYTKDREMIRQNEHLAKYYGLASLYTAEKMRKLSMRGLVSWWNWFGGNDAGDTAEYIHPTDIGRILFTDEFKHALCGSIYNNNLIVTALPDAINADSAVFEGCTTYFSDEFGVKAGSTKHGTWVPDENMASNGTLAGLAGRVRGTELGEYPQPVRSSAQGDYIEITWIGKHFGIWFLGTDNRDTAKITVDGVVYSYQTNFGAPYNATISYVYYPAYNTFLNPDDNPNNIVLTQGSHTLRVEQKNVGSGKEIAIAVVVVF